MNEAMFYLGAPKNEREARRRAQRATRPAAAGPRYPRAVGPARTGRDAGPDTPRTAKPEAAPERQQNAGERRRAA